MSNKERLYKGDRFNIKGRIGVFRFIVEFYENNLWRHGFVRYRTENGPAIFEGLEIDNKDYIECETSMLGQVVSVKVPFSDLEFDKLVYEL